MTSLSYPIYNAHTTGSVATDAEDNALSPHAVITRTVTSTQKIRQLSVHSDISAGSDMSLTTISSSLVDYVVPTGKTAKLFMIVRAVGADAKVEVREDDTADAGTGTLKYSTNNGTGSIDTLDLNTNAMLTICPEWDAVEKTFAAGKYITVSAITGGLSVVWAAVIEE